MIVHETNLSDVILVEPRRFADHRGYFSETYSAKAYDAIGISAHFVQDNQSLSSKAGTIRGLHFQAPPHAQDKLVRCGRGRIFDVAVDIRKGSPTFGQWVGYELSAQNALQLFIPAGFAHGFVTLEADCEIVYKCSDYYAPQTEGSLRWDDPDLAIDWPLRERAVLSDKDSVAPFLSAFTSPFEFGA